MKYDYLIVGSGLYGAVLAHELNKKGRKVLVIEKRNHLGGNIYCESIEGIMVHKYGAHIFHTSNKDVWNYINKFAEFNNYTNSPIAIYKNSVYNLPFNMNTFSKLFNITKPSEALAIINKERLDSLVEKPQNLEEQAINLVGKTIYELLIKEYTEKQWGKPCKELPSDIIKRLPVRFTYDNNYFNDRYQGIPLNGYTNIIEKMLEGIEVRLNCNYLEDKEYYNSLADKILYSGPIDEFFDYKLGELEYRSLRFENEIIECSNYQGNAVCNYTSLDVPYTRIIEHKHFVFDTNSPKSVITKEYPITYKPNCGLEPYYPINNSANQDLYNKYLNLASKTKNIIFIGRLGLYKYLDMDKVIEEALLLAATL